MVVRSFHLPNPQIRIKPNVGLQLSINNANIRVSGRWKARKSFVYVAMLVAWRVGSGWCSGGV